MNGIFTLTQMVGRTGLVKLNGFQSDALPFYSLFNTKALWRRTKCFNPKYAVDNLFQSRTASKSKLYTSFDSSEYFTVFLLVKTLDFFVILLLITNEAQLYCLGLTTVKASLGLCCAAFRT